MRILEFYAIFARFGRWNSFRARPPLTSTIIDQFAAISAS